MAIDRDAKLELEMMEYNSAIKKDGNPSICNSRNESEGHYAN